MDALAVDDGVTLAVTDIDVDDVPVTEGVTLGVLVTVGVAVTLGVTLGVRVAVRLGVAVSDGDAVAVRVGEDVEDSDTDGVRVRLSDTVGVTVRVRDIDGDTVGVAVIVGVTDGVAEDVGVDDSDGGYCTAQKFSTTLPDVMMPSGHVPVPDDVPGLLSESLTAEPNMPPLSSRGRHTAPPARDTPMMMTCWPGGTPQDDVMPSAYDDESSLQHSSCSVLELYVPSGSAPLAELPLESFCGAAQCTWRW
jgi:hypothetical protein